MPVDLTDPRAPRVRRIQALAGRSARIKRGLFLIEGPQSVREALTHAPAVVREVYMHDEAAARYPEIAELAPEAIIGTPQVLNAMSSDAQGVLAIGMLEGDPFDGEWFTGQHLATDSLVAFLQEVRDPGNAGTVIRAADAAGADGVVLSANSVQLHNPKVVRSTAGSLFHLPIAAEVDLPSAAAIARAAGMQVLAADGAGEVTLDALIDASEAPGARSGSLDLGAPTMWVFGNEAHGLTAADRQVADAVVRIDIHPRVESLNLAMAATLCLFASARAQRGGDQGRGNEASGAQGSGNEASGNQGSGNQGSGAR